MALHLAFAACVGVCSPAWATTEAEAVDELIAVLGATLPCPKYGVAWLADPPRQVEHRCAASAAEALTVSETVPRDRVWYLVDMDAARDRYMSVYRLRGTPTPAVVLAQFLSSVATLGQSSPPDRPASPLMVYSKSVGAPAPSSAPVTPERPLTTPTTMIFAR